MGFRLPWNQPDPPPKVPDRREDAERAIQDARKKLEQTKRNRPKTVKLAQAFREIRRQNDFANDIRRALGDHR